MRKTKLLQRACFVWDSKQGSVNIAVALAVPFLFGAIGVAYDFSRAAGLQTRLQGAADLAASEVVRGATEADASARAVGSVDAYMREIGFSNPSAVTAVKFSRTNSIVSAQVTAPYSALFGAFYEATGRTITVGANSSDRFFCAVPQPERRMVDATKQCATGYTGTIAVQREEVRTATCASNTSQPVWGGWNATGVEREISNSCSKKCVIPATGNAETRIYETGRGCDGDSIGSWGERYENERHLYCPSENGDPLWTEWKLTKRLGSYNTCKWRCIEEGPLYRWYSFTAKCDVATMGAGTYTYQAEQMYYKKCFAEYGKLDDGITLRVVNNWTPTGNFRNYVYNCANYKTCIPSSERKMELVNGSCPAGWTGTQKWRVTYQREMYCTGATSSAYTGWVEVAREDFGGCTAPPGHMVWDTPGEYTFQVPQGVSTISAVAVGGGAAGARDSTFGQSAGGTSGLMIGGSWVLSANGGRGQAGGCGGVKQGGGCGGVGAIKDYPSGEYAFYYLGEGAPDEHKTVYHGGAGGGGAGGYSCNGANGTIIQQNVPSCGGAGGGAGATLASGAGGGGVGLYGQGASASWMFYPKGGGDNTAEAYGGFGGSGGDAGQSAIFWVNKVFGGNGGRYGGGGGAASVQGYWNMLSLGPVIGGGGGELSWINFSVKSGTIIKVVVGAGGVATREYSEFGQYSGNGGGGAVRILWGQGRGFPSSNVGSATN